MSAVRTRKAIIVSVRNDIPNHRPMLNVPRASRPLCAACHQETCHHSDLEYAGLIPAGEVLRG